jgi:hypothetical protein
MRIAILFATLTIGWFFVLGKVTDRYSSDDGSRWRVADRFLERGEEYNDTTLASWVRNNAAAARGYAIPVLFPFDVVFMLLLAGFLALASTACAESIPWLNPFAWAFAILPALYGATDLLEDTLLARLLLKPKAITAGAVRTVQSVTRLKLLSSALAMAQTIAISVLAILLGSQAR